MDRSITAAVKSDIIAPSAIVILVPSSDSTKHNDRMIAERTSELLTDTIVACE
ncbi:hypothetical protein BN903_144 [Halorubrum sp. AJ67]|nr:hypothetical protein BN903_144 [Halorubrum sp. AJ67]